MVLQRSPPGELRHTLEIQLSGDAWVDDLGEEGAASTAQLLGALTSAQDGRSAKVSQAAPHS